MKIRDIQSLLTYIKENEVSYTFFWGHQEKKGMVSKSCFSQWYEASFEIEGVEYKTAEHYMMAEKARLFEDNAIVEEILATEKPIKVKKLGRKISGFDEELWNKHRFDIVVAGNLAKFAQNKELLEFIVSTGDSVLVEASPVDNIWGIGMAQDHASASIPAEWKGLNLLGFALMEVRDILKPCKANS